MPALRLTPQNKLFKLDLNGIQVCSSPTACSRAVVVVVVVAVVVLAVAVAVAVVVVGCRRCAFRYCYWCHRRPRRPRLRSESPGSCITIICRRTRNKAMLVPVETPLSFQKSTFAKSRKCSQQHVVLDLPALQRQTRDVKRQK